MPGHSEYAHFSVGNGGLPTDGEPRPVRIEDGLVVGCDGVRYRQTPPGEPTVRDLLPPGTRIRTSYGTGGQVVAVTERHFCPCPHRFGPPIDPKDHLGPYCHPVRTFSVDYARPDDPARRRRTRGTVNEAVAVGGRILFLFEANRDEILVEPAADEHPEGGTP